MKNLSRLKRQTTTTTEIGQNIICKLVTPTNNNLAQQWRYSGAEIETNVIKDHHTNPDESETILKECYEYKEFGSDWLKAFFNRTILTGSDKDRMPYAENFYTQYQLGARMLGENLFMGQIDISKHNDASKLRINLFGSEYVDLNLCDIRDKIFSQANKIPLFTENIWFMTNVAINLKYDLQFRVQVPNAVCEQKNGNEKEKEQQILSNNSNNNINSNSNSNSVILSQIISDQFNLNQNSKIEIGGLFEASFLVGAKKLKTI